MTDERIERILHPVPDGSYSIVHAKELIFKDLCKDPDIFELLDNKELLEKNALPEDYYFVNIYPFLKIPDVQSKVKNFICYEIDDLEDYTANNVKIRRQVKIRVASHEQSVQTPYGVLRQDLLAMIIDERMQWANFLGAPMKKVYDAGKVAENGYYYRNMYYELAATNNLQYGASENILDWKGRNYYSLEDSFN